MFFDLRAAIQALMAAGTPFTIANQARAGSSYLFNAVLPAQNRNTYHVSGGNMTVRATMAGMVGMDSPFPKGGAVEMSTFEENTIKIANSSRFPEQQLRELQALIAQLSLSGGNSNQAITQTALNFYDKIIIQGHLDTEEWLRAQALTLGKIDWTFDGKRVEVDYGVPSGNFLTARTGNNGYGGSTSKFWEDLRLGKRKLNGQVKAWIMHSDTKEMILSNDVNNFKLLSEDANGFSVVRYKVVGGTTIESTDPRDRSSFITYDEEGEIWDLSNPGQTIKIPFMPRGIILGIGNFVKNKFIVGSGGTTPPAQESLGYTHIAPTVEGGGTPGRWGRLFTPEGEPWSFVGEAVTNLLPVVEAPDRIVVLTTEMV